VLAALFDGSGAWGERAQQIANAQGISRRTLYRWLARYRDVATTSALIPIPRGTPPGAHRLDATRETLVNKIIEQEYLSRSRPTVEEIVRIVERRCVERRFKPVSRNAIRARTHQLDPRTRTRTRYGAKAAQSKHAATPGSFPVEDVLQSVQIDHARHFPVPPASNSVGVLATGGRNLATLLREMKPLRTRKSSNRSFTEFVSRTATRQVSSVRRRSANLPPIALEIPDASSLLSTATTPRAASTTLCRFRISQAKLVICDTWVKT
jgi:hypothetical protein